MAGTIRFLFFFVTIIWSVSLLSHELWVSHVESVEGGHHMAFIGYGHRMPLEDSLVDDWGAIRLDHYDLISPENKKIPLGIPDTSPVAVHPARQGVIVQESADLGLRKIKLDSDAEEGVYQIAGGTPMTFFTRYRDKNNRVAFAEVRPEKIEDLKEVIRTSVYGMYFKTQFYHGEAADKPVAAVGHPLEIVPVSHLQGVQVGARVTFKVLSNGRPLRDQGAYFLARNMAFDIDQPIHVKLINGEGVLRLPIGGDWRIDAYKEAPPEDFAGMDEYEGKVMSVSHSASFTFFVSP